MAADTRFFAHSFDGGNNYCVLDGKNKIVSTYDDMDYRDAHALAREMNDEAGTIASASDEPVIGALAPVAQLSPEAAE